MRALPIDPVLLWEDTSVMVVNVPVVARLDGDEIPDVVVLTVPRLYRHETLPPDRNSLIAYSGRDGRRLWTLDAFVGPCSHSPPAVGDVDGDGRAEVVILARPTTEHRHTVFVEDPPTPRPEFCIDTEFCAEWERCSPFHPDAGGDHLHCGDPSIHIHRECSTYGDPPGAIVVVSGAGEIVRTIPLPPMPRIAEMDAVEIVDLDGDGRAEIVAHGVVAGAEGVRWHDERLSGVSAAIGDVDGDGTMEIVTPTHAFEHDGALRWTVEDGDPHAHAILGRLSRDPLSRGPELISAGAVSMIVRDASSGAMIFGPVGFGSGRSSGPPALADFDGDGRLEVGVVGSQGYVVIDPDLPAPPHVRWTAPTLDHTPGTVGASAYDFDGDGAYDVAYSDECHLRVLSGRDGRTLFARSNPSITVWEYPIAADVDADGETELIAGANLRLPSYIETSHCAARADPWVDRGGGLRVYEDRLHHFGSTRAHWSQHQERAGDGTWRAAPRAPDPRDMPLPSLEVSALAVGDGCGSRVVRARVENRGSRASDPGAIVALGAGGRTVATARVERALVPGAAEWITFASVELAGPITVSSESECAAGEPIPALELDCE